MVFFSRWLTSVKSLHKSAERAAAALLARPAVPTPPLAASPLLPPPASASAARTAPLRNGAAPAAAPGVTHAAYSAAGSGGPTGQRDRAAPALSQAVRAILRSFNSTRPFGLLPEQPVRPASRPPPPPLAPVRSPPLPRSSPTGSAAGRLTGRLTGSCVPLPQPPAHGPLPPEGVSAVPRKLSRGGSGPERGPVAAAIGRRSRYPRRDGTRGRRLARCRRPGWLGSAASAGRRWVLVLLALFPGCFSQGCPAGSSGKGRQRRLPGSPVGGSSPASHLLPWESGWDVPCCSTYPPSPSEVWVRSAGSLRGGGGGWVAAGAPRGGERQGQGGLRPGIVCGQGWPLGVSPPCSGAGAGGSERASGGG